jgi:hypothetical protein
MDTWYQRFINWFSDIPPGVPATVIREPDHVILIVRPDDAASAPVAVNKKMNARIPVVKKAAKKKRKV